MRIWDLFWRYKALFTSLSLAGLSAGILLALLLTPIYRAEAVLAAVPDPGAIPGVEALGSQFGGVASLLGIAGAGESRVQEYLAVLRSRVFTDKFIAEQEIIPVLFEERFFKENGEWKLLEGEDLPTREDAYQLFHKKIRHVAESKQTGLITIAIDWRDGELASRWANELVSLANRELRRRAIQEGEENIEFLNSELARTNVIEIQQSIFKLIEAQIQNIMVANVREEYAFRVIDPAAAPDVDDPRSPNRPLIVLVFSAFGALLGLLAASILDGLRSRRAGGAAD